MHLPWYVFLSNGVILKNVMKKSQPIFLQFFFAILVPSHKYLILYKLSLKLFFTKFNHCVFYVPMYFETDFFQLHIQSIITSIISSKSGGGGATLLR